MSDKRFTVDKVGIYDTQEKKHFKFIAYDWIDCDIYECCEKLNEQQATIRRLQDLCGESDGENAKLRIENKKLKAKLKEKEEDERVYANEIVELRKTNEEWLQFKELGGDY